MIDGVRLAEITAFHRSVVQNEIIRVAEKLLPLDTRLNILRVEEAFAYRSYAAARTESPDASLENVRKVWERRHDTVTTSIKALKSAETRAMKLRGPVEDSADEAERAQQGLKAMEAKIESACRRDPHLAVYAEEMRAIAKRVREIAGWLDEGRAAIRPVMDSIHADPVYMYLLRRKFGTDDYQASGLMARMDAWLADRGGYEAAIDKYRAVADYPVMARKWQTECETRYSILSKRSEQRRAMIGSSLEQCRANLKSALNKKADLHQEFEAALAASREALDRILQIVFASDREGGELVKRFVELLTRERQQATMRMARSGGDVDQMVSTRIDAIVAERISISVEADALRRQIAEAHRRLKDIDEVQDLVAQRGWATHAVKFALEEQAAVFGDMSAGRTTAKKAWATIQGSVIAATVGPVHAEAAALSA